MAVTYIFPDIHGCAKTFRHLLEDIVSPTLKDKLVFLGDYIDRGPNSAEVINMILSLISSGYQVTALRGNHEQMLLDSIADANAFTIWKLNSARKTLKSYGLDFEDVAHDQLISLIPKDHLHFLQNMPILHQLGSSLWSVHGCIQFPIREEFLQHYLWLRPWECVDSIPEGVTVIHGHTPIPLEEVENQIALWGRLINLDAGCVYAEMREGLGNLVCLRLEDRHLFYTPNIDL
ncbi:MAG TPA: metallophosphoesterase family protein [Williamwhitmania sp.]|nr:metallophosphoesterase family protein [Williamwhitmania sp.]